MRVAVEESWKVLEICLRLDIRCVSVYAFAIENFKRSPEEVEALMDLCQRKMLELCEHGYVHPLLNGTKADFGFLETFYRNTT